MPPSGRTLSYRAAPNSSCRWDVYLLGRKLGTLTKGSASAYFKTPSGRGRLFPSFLDAARALDQVANRIREKVEAA